MTHPRSACGASTLKGATLAARQSRFRGVRLVDWGHASDLALIVDTAKWMKM